MTIGALKLANGRTQRVHPKQAGGAAGPSAPSGGNSKVLEFGLLVLAWVMLPGKWDRLATLGSLLIVMGLGPCAETGKPSLGRGEFLPGMVRA